MARSNSARRASFWIAKALALLAFGAVVTAATVWVGIRNWDEHTRRVTMDILTTFGWAPPLTPAELVWPMPVPRDWPAPVGASVEHGRGWTHRWATATTKSWTEGGTDRHGGSTSFGWPLHAVREHSWYFEDRLNRRSSKSVALRSEWVKQRLGVSIVPLEPVWPGLVGDTLLYAALAWGLLQIPAAVRRRGRMKKVRCARCGYSLEGLTAGAVCPECGTTPRA